MTSFVKKGKNNDFYQEIFDKISSLLLYYDSLILYLQQQQIS